MRTDLAAARAPSGVGAIDVAAETSPGEWDAFVQGIRATGYHEWAWRRVFERAFGHETIYLSARSDGIDGVLPLVHIASRVFGRCLVSLPFVNYGGVAARHEAAARALLDRAAEIARQSRCRHVELRHTARQFDDLACKQHKVAMYLPLGGDVEAAWDQLDRKVRNQVRKAQKSALTTEIGGAELLDDFYVVFARNMRDLGTPVYAKRFFGEVLAAFPARARVHVVRLAGAPVAAGVTFRTRATVEVPWASSIREHNALCPNQLLYWSIVEAATKEGCGLLDFGRSTPNEGTFRFKQQWGAQPAPLYWEYHLADGGAMPNTSPTNPKFQTAIALWKRLPVPIATWLGPAIVRSIP